MMSVQSLSKACIVAIALSCAAAPSPALSQDIDPGIGSDANPAVKTSFVHLAGGVPAVLYEPVNSGPKAKIAVFAMHSAGDFLTHSVCSQLSARGYRVFCENNSNDKSRDFNDGNLDRVLLEAKLGIQWLRKYPGVEKIVLWGHSGGATVMTAYQDIAENGVGICQEKIDVWKCPDTLIGLPPADGVILGDANWGIANDVLTGIDPSIGNDNGMVTVDPALDMYNPDNGFDPKGSHFSAAFIKRFTAAQARRYNDVVNLALARKALIEAGAGMYSDNEPFTIAGAIFTGNKLYASDMSLLSHTRAKWPLLHKDGSTTMQVVPSVRVPTTTTSPSRSIRGALKTTVNGFLSTYALRATEDFGYGAVTDETGVIFRSGMASNPGNVEGINVPFLTMAMTGSFEMGSAETIHNHVAAKDKTLVYVEGATHVYTPCTKCEKTPGQYGDTMKVTYDYADPGWLSQKGRFLD